MFGKTFDYRWEWQLKSDPQRLWPWVSNTNRFDFDAGLPTLERLSMEKDSKGFPLTKVKSKANGMTLEWEENPFEWLYPHRFGVLRRYSRGPFLELSVRVDLKENSGGTLLVYHLWGIARNAFWNLILKRQLAHAIPKAFERVFRKYDQFALENRQIEIAENSARLEPHASERIDKIQNLLLEENVSASGVHQLVKLIKEADDLTIAKMRPYIFADEWKIDRKNVLELFLTATRLGLLEFRWNLLCPLCRGSQASKASLREIDPDLHCETCRIDFKVNLDRFVEISFQPNASIRSVETKDFCVGSPQRTPHVVIQQPLEPGEEKYIPLSLEKGRYRLRCLGKRGSKSMMIDEAGDKSGMIEVSDKDFSAQEIILTLNSDLKIINRFKNSQLIIIERVEWADQATTAAEVIALQKFRDLFSHEVLKPGQEISVGSMAVLFTDVKSSTHLYREIGDAPAFGLVMNHFDILKTAISEEGGSLVKTIGDAVMAVFPRPLSAIKAILAAKEKLEHPSDGSRPLKLKSGIHFGHCIAVTLNDRLDYFGTTINLASRLEQFSSGEDLILSDFVLQDPEVRDFVDSNQMHYKLDLLETSLKGFDAEQFKLWRLTPVHETFAYRES